MTTTDLIHRARVLQRKHTTAQLTSMCEAAGHLMLAGWSKQELAVEAARAEQAVAA